MMVSNDILERQNQLRLSNTGCDVIFEIGDSKFPAHRMVLMARVEHFQKMFTAEMREKKESTVEFDSHIIHPDVFEEILNYIYTSKIDFTDENIRPIYKAADYFCFDELINKAKGFMLDSMNSMKAENVISYRSYAVEFNLDSFRDDCEQFMIDYIPSDVIQSQLIPTLSSEELRGFTDKLKEKGKFEDMFNYSVEWILQDEANRAGMFFELLKNIPLESLSFLFLKLASDNELVRKDRDCLKLVNNAIIAISEPLHLSNTFRRGKSKKETLYAIGGMDGGVLSSVSEFSSTTRKWIATLMPSQLSHFCCAVIESKIYLFGGHDGKYTNSVTVFDTNTRVWKELKPMKHSRANCSAAVLDGYIYVAGGWNGFENSAVVERYCPQTDHWQDVTPMTTKRTELELVELDGSLYAIGGTGDNGKHNTVERYDPQTGWTVMSCMNNKYVSFGSAVLNGYIYIAGNGKCEVYSPKDNKWTEMPAPNECEWGIRLAAFDGKLYSIGGRIGEMKDRKGSKTVQVFDFQARVWRQETDMDVARCCHGVAVVKK